MSEIWDYIVVGAGSAGCVLANRLSANPKNRVLLLEAGPKDRNPWIHIPIGYYKTMLSDLSWGYDTQPEKELNNRQVHWPRGKVLGGSSSINGLLYIRGQREDYDHWRQLGNTGWGSEDVLPYFKRAEDNERGGDDWRGEGGPLKVSDLRDKREICDAFIAAAEAEGIPHNSDFNGAEQEGVGYFQTTSGGGLRCSSAVGYLKPARNRANLKIETGALASRLRLDDKRATGVHFLQDGVEKLAECRGEIVLSGGAVNSPQLLQLSGIGPADSLAELGIAISLDLPGVGRGVCETLCMGISPCAFYGSFVEPFWV